LPEHALHNARVLAEEKKLEGWIINLEFPSYIAVITYAEDRSLREEIYRAFVTRASEETPSPKEFNNSALMDEIIALRHEKAKILGFANFAELSIATKMAESTDKVMTFLNDLTLHGHKQAENEFKHLQAFAKDEHKIDKIPANPCLSCCDGTPMRSTRRAEAPPLVIRSASPLISCEMKALRCSEVGD
jgi:oligopeptidase A